MTGGQVAEDEEYVAMEYVARNRSSVSVNITGDDEMSKDVSSVVVVTPSHIPVELKLPVTRMHLMLIEEHFNPPGLELCHQLLYEQKAKIHIQDLTGKSDREKREIENFWVALEAELSTLGAAPSFRAEDSLLAQLLGEIKSMLVYLYPDSKLLREQLLPSFDVPFIVEQLKYGHLNVPDIAESLCHVFKANCAPKRDVVVDQILNFGRAGEWIKMLKLCLELMELMKLDLINYRLTVNRQTVLAGFLQREREHFDQLCGRGILTLTTTKLWLRKARESAQSDDVQECVQQGFLDLLTCSFCGGVPETFAIDAKRLQDVRTMLQDITIVISAMLVFENFLGKKPSRSAVGEVKQRVVRLLSSRTSKISDITDQILLVVSRLHGRPISHKQREVLSGMVDKILDPSHQVFALVRSRLRTLIGLYICGDKVDVELFTRCRLESVKVDLEALLPALKMMWLVQWKVHRARYTRLLSEMSAD